MKSRILNPKTGKPFALEPSWPAAGTGRRVRHWYPTTSSINDLLATGGVDLVRTRTRQETRRNAFAGRVRDLDSGFTVGTGVKPVLQLDDEQTRRDWMEVWDEFVENADADGTNDFYGLQWLIYTAAREGGDCFVRYRTRRPEDGLTVPLQLQALEAELCDATQHRQLGGGRVIRAGIEFDAVGRRRAYWMFRNHPGESLLGGSFDPVPVPADQISHVYRVLRPGQVRGIPNLAGVLATLKEIEDARDAHVLRKKIANLYVSWEETPTAGTSVFDDQVEDGPSSSSPETEDDDEVYSPEAGDHHVLPPGRKVAFSEPPRDSEDFASFLKAQLRTIAAGAGSLYEHVSGDHESVSFSSIRAGLIALRRMIEPVQAQMLCYQLCRPVWRRFVETAVLAGVLPMPSDAREQRRLMRPRWQPPGWEYVEPEKDIRTAVRKIRAGLSSPEREAAKLGVDVREVLEEIARDVQRARDLGLNLDIDGSSDADGSARAAALTEGGAGDAGEPGDGGSAAAEGEDAHVAA